MHPAPLLHEPERAAWKLSGQGLEHCDHDPVEAADPRHPTIIPTPADSERGADMVGVASWPGVYAGCTSLSLDVFGRHRGRARSLGSCGLGRLCASRDDTGSTLVMMALLRRGFCVQPPEPGVHLRSALSDASPNCSIASGYRNSSSWHQIVVPNRVPT